MENKIEVVLLVGSGRSGSTLIDRVLDIHPEIFGVGELINFDSAIFGEYCSCGKKIESCEFWSNVISTLGWSEEDFAKYRDYQRKFEKPQRGRVFKIEDFTDDPDFNDYLSRSVELYKTITSLNGDKIIFDSSKSPQRAYNLSKSDALDIKIVYLMRDPRGVAWSFKKSFKKDLKAGLQNDLKGRSVLKSIYSWLAVNSKSFSLIRLTNTPCLYVKYEEFSRMPSEQIGRILEFIFEGKPHSSIDLEDAGDTTSHTMAGNRLRMQKTIEIKPDDAWKRNLNPFQKSFINLLTHTMVRNFNKSIERN